MSASMTIDCKAAENEISMPTLFDMEELDALQESTEIETVAA